MDISTANSRRAMRKLIKTGVVTKKSVLANSRSRIRRRSKAKSMGRHSGHGKRRGSREARLPTKVLWIRRIRILRRLICKYRNNNKIDQHLHHELYMKCKGNVFKNKRVLMEAVCFEKVE